MDRDSSTCISFGWPVNTRAVSMVYVELFVRITDGPTTLK